MNHVESYTHIDVCATFIYLYFWVDNLMFVQLVTSISGKIKKKKKNHYSGIGKMPTHPLNSEVVAKTLLELFY